MSRSEDSNRSTQPASDLTSDDAMDRLVTACVAGDASAMKSIYEHCSSRVYGLMVRMVGRQDADDLTQQVFLQMFRKLNQFSGQSKLETWLFRLATNEALQHLRKQKKRLTAPLLSEPVATDDNRLIKCDEARLLEAALNRLDPELRAVFLLKEQNGLSYREIAESLGIPEGTVGSRLNRARKELRQELTKRGWS